MRVCPVIVLVAGNRLSATLGRPPACCHTEREAEKVCCISSSLGPEKAKKTGSPFCSDFSAVDKYAERPVVCISPQNGINALSRFPPLLHPFRSYRRKLPDMSFDIETTFCLARQLCPSPRQYKQQSQQWHVTSPLLSLISPPFPR